VEARLVVRLGAVVDPKLLAFFERFASWRFFVGYAVAGLVYFVVLLISLSPPVGDAVSMTVGLLTGGDPYEIRNPIEKCWATWVGAWLLHTVSWVFVPALIGLLVTQAAARMESARWRAFDHALDDIARLGNLTPAETVEFKQRARNGLSEELAREHPPTR
jgi:hypothetical protein